MVDPTRIYISRNVVDYSGEPNDGDIMMWNSSGSYWEPIDPPPASLSEIADVNITSPSEMQLIRYDATSGSWVNISPSELRPAFNDLVDVNITSPVDGSLIKFEESSGSWVDGTLDLDDLANVTASSPNDGDGIYYDDGLSEWVTGSPSSGSQQAPLLHVFNEDVSSSGSDFNTSFVYIGNSLQVTWNGVRQSAEYFTEKAEHDGFTTDFIVLSGDELLVDYVRSSSGSLGASGDGNASHLQSRYVNPTAPVAGEALKWDGAQWIPGAVASTSGSDAVKLQGNPISTVNPTDGQALVWDDGEKHWEPQDQTGSGSGIDAEKIQGRDVADTAPSDGQALVWDSGASQWEPGNVAAGNGGGGSGSAGYDLWNPNLPPATTSGSMNDEFDDESFDTEMWNEFDPGSLLNVVEDKYGVKLWCDPDAGPDVCGIWQFLPDDGEWTIETRLEIIMEERDAWAHAGLVLFEGNGATSDFYGIFFNYGRAGAYNQRYSVIHYADYQNQTSEKHFENGAYFHTNVYFRIRKTSGSGYYFDWSHDGHGWYVLYNETSFPFTPVHVGIVNNREDVFSQAIVRSTFFRYRNEAAGLAEPVQGDFETTLTSYPSSGPGDADFTVWNAELPPTTSGSQNDEFDDESFDTSKWSTFDVPGGLTKTEHEYGLELSSSAANKIQGIYQRVLTSQDFSFVTLLSGWGPQSGNEAKVGLFLLEDVDNLSTSDIYTYAMYFGSGGTGMQIELWSDYQTHSSTVHNYPKDTWPASYYLRLRLTSGNWYVDWSWDGFSWVEKYIDTRSWAPTGYGLFLRVNGTHQKFVFHFFRYTDTYSVKDLVGGLVKMWRAD